MLLLTGARRGNVQAMRWADLDLRRGLWRIPESQSKSREPMTVILAPEVMHILRRRRAEVAGAAYVFPGRGKAEHLIDPKTPWQRVVKRARLKDVTMHDLRRTLGSWQAMGGSGLPIIGKSLGRRTTSTEQIYARLSVDPVRESVHKATAAMITAADGAQIINGGGGSNVL